MSAESRPAPRPMPRTGSAAVVSGGFGLAYAFVVFQAVTLLVTQANGPLGLNGFGWALLTAAAVAPVVVFAVAFALAWRRGAGKLALVLLAGLCLTAVFWLDVVGYAYADGAALLGS